MNVVVQKSELDSTSFNYSRILKYLSQVIKKKVEIDKERKNIKKTITSLLSDITYYYELVSQKKNIPNLISDKFNFILNNLKNFYQQDKIFLDSCKDLLDSLKILKKSYQFSINEINRNKLNSAVYQKLIQKISLINDDKLKNSLFEIFKSRELYVQHFENSLRSEKIFLDDAIKYVFDIGKKISSELGILVKLFNEENEKNILEFLNDKTIENDLIYSNFLDNFKWSMNDFEFQDKLFSGYKDAIYKSGLKNSKELKLFSKYLNKLIRLKRVKQNARPIIKFVVVLAFGISIFSGFGAQQTFAQDNTNGEIEMNNQDQNNLDNNIENNSIDVNQNFEHDFQISEQSKLRVLHARNPTLNQFRDSTALLYETQRDPISFLNLRNLTLSQRYMIGLVNMPNFVGLSAFKNDATGIQNNMALMSAQLGFDFNRKFNINSNTIGHFNAGHEVFARIGVNLFDPGGKTGSYNLLNSTNAGSLSTYENTFNASFSFLRPNSALSKLRVSWISHLVETLYLTNSVKAELSLTPDETFNLFASIDYSTAETINGINANVTKAGATIDVLGTVLGAEAQFRTNEPVQIAITGRIPLGNSSNRQRTQVRLNNNSTQTNQDLDVSNIPISDTVNLRQEVHETQSLLSQDTGISKFLNTNNSNIIENLIDLRTGNVTNTYENIVNNNERISYYYNISNRGLNRNVVDFFRQHNVEFESQIFDITKLSNLSNLYENNVQFKNMCDSILNGDVNTGLVGDNLEELKNILIEIRNFTNESSEIRNYVDNVDSRSQLVEEQYHASEYLNQISHLSEEQLEIMRGIVQPWDESVLKRNDMTFNEISSFLVYNADNINNYDYNRANNSSASRLRSPSEFLQQGGVCRDAAYFVADLFKQNGFNSHLVSMNSVNSPRHAFAMVQRDDGNYSSFEYEKRMDIQSNNLFEASAAAANAINPFLSLYIIEPERYNNKFLNVSHVIYSPDGTYLNDISNFK